MSELKIVYKVEKPEYQWDKTMRIESNLKEDMVEWKISKSLSDKIILESACLEPEKLILEIAESQRRGIECEISNLSELELEMKTKKDSIKSILGDVLDDQIKSFENNSDEIWKAINSFKDKVSNHTKELQKIVNPILEAKKTIEELDGYKLRTFFESVETIRKLQENSPELLDFVSKNFTVNKNQ